MKKLFFITLILLVQSFPSYGEYDGEMECEIKKQSVYSVNNGNTESFIGIKDGKIVGEFFTLNYRLNNGIFTLEVSSENKEQNIAFNHSYKINFLNPKIQFEKWREPLYIKAIDKDKRVFLHKFLEMRKDKLKIGYMGESQIIIKRYYKSDWEGTYSENNSLKNSPILTHFYSFDCKHSSNDHLNNILDEIFKMSF